VIAKSISGIFPALTTPFEKGDLSPARLKGNIEKYNKVDLSGYLVLGSTGEGILMNETERLTAIETVRSAASEGKIIVAGTGAQSNRATIEFTNRAGEAGAHYALVVTPFYFKAQMTAKNLEAYYRQVAEEAKIPLLLYNVPKFTGLELPLETVVALANHPNIVGLKDSSGNIASLGQILRECPPDFSDPCFFPPSLLVRAAPSWRCPIWPLKKPLKSIGSFGQANGKRPKTSSNGSLK